MTTTQTTKCTRCGRQLRSSASIARGYGRHCMTKVNAAAKAETVTAAFKPFQVTKAVEVIELRAIARTAPELYLVVSSDGDTNYEVDQHSRSCTCKAGERGLPCYHLAAADILAAA